MPFITIILPKKWKRWTIEMRNINKHAIYNHYSSKKVKIMDNWERNINKNAIYNHYSSKKLKIDKWEEEYKQALYLQQLFFQKNEKIDN
jgi:AcrR family transcriptional regulator